MNEEEESWQTLLNSPPRDTSPSIHGLVESLWLNMSLLMWLALVKEILAREMQAEA